ncbi:hypothetical protein HYALB_00003054 [Hymenoscyphus albidus]|uniref:Pyrroline-5-carboxylate reductase dimerisation domain-containing protein n=1 Tax=Hymenoscyphus albidus TaxID=595503 RepID=A0A9N9LX52_9HELO|nr:hypothetical protein HYALB_00003054 [Hymenoscyphus albidus]
MDIFFRRIEHGGASHSPIEEGKTPKRSTTLAVLGCGNLGTSLLCGILATLKDRPNETSSLPSFASLPSSSSHEIDNETASFTPPTNFAAYVRTTASASRLQTALAPFPTHVRIYTDLENLHKADIIILACQRADLQTCLGNSEVRAALAGKTLISLLPGATIHTLSSMLAAPDDTSQQPSTIIRAMANISSSVRQSMTIIEAPSSTPAPILKTVDWLFTSIGTVKHLSGHNFDPATSLCASTPAFFALVVEALTDAAVSAELAREDAQIMAAQAMKGCAELIMAGQHPALVRDEISTPGGSTIRGLLRLEKGGVRSNLAEAFFECVKAVDNLGKK